MYLSDNESLSCHADSVHSLSDVTGSPPSDSARKYTGDVSNDEGLDEPPPPAENGDLAEVSHILVSECYSEECFRKLCARDANPYKTDNGETPMDDGQPSY